MNDPSRVSPIKRALRAIERLEGELAAERRARREPIAIVGMACRFPGGADTPAAYWERLRRGDDAITEVPPERWDLATTYDPDPAAPGKMNVRYGSFLPGIDRFDPAFFGISPREAVCVEPQQRLLLEVAWEALESAHIVPEHLFGGRTGVFVGIDGNDYEAVIADAAPQLRDELYSATGNATSVASGRLSYVLGLTGPSLSIDTACSSSLVAVHEACQSLRAGECERALAGGVNLVLRPELTVTLCKAQMLSPRGRCRVFDAGADGYVRGDGCGVLVLRRLSDAEQAGDRILAVIRGSMINQDGRSSGLTAPSGPSQQAVIQAALAAAGVAPHEIGYVEAHGTGTPLGDPIEVGALDSVFRERSGPLHVGSVKSNIGHLEAAAGVAGLIKVVLALQARQIPPNLHFEHPNPFIDWEGSPVHVPTALTPWPEDAPLAGVSGFGFSGTNAHVILEAPPVRDASPHGASPDGASPRVEAPPAPTERAAQLLLLSARSEEALGDLAGRYARLLERDDVPLADLCLSVATGRSRFPWRIAVVADSPAAMREALLAETVGPAPARVQRGRVPAEGEGGTLAFLFTGQGSQYAGMGRGLDRTEPVFREALDRCDAILRPLLGAPLREVMHPAHDDGRLDTTGWTQPALFALEYALAQLWASWGIRPDLVLGHSVGELVAACLAGVFSLEDGLRLVAARGRLMQSLPEGGGMLAVEASEDQVRELLPASRGSLALAAINGPASVVVSGRLDQLDGVAAALRAQGISVKPLTVSHAFHSSLVDPVLGQLERTAASLRLEAPRIPLVSNVSGALAGPELATAAYWTRHAREPVRFASGVAAMIAAGATTFVEIGPGTTLLGMARGCVDDGPHLAWLPSLRRKRDDRRQILGSAASLVVRGYALDVAAPARSGGARQRVDLPFYPFQRRRFWPEPRPEATPRPAARDGGLALQELRSPALPSGARVFELALRVADLPYLGDHRLGGEVVVPAAGFLALFLTAAAALGEQDAVLEHLEMPRALVLRDDQTRIVQVIVDAPHDGAAALRLVSLAADATWEVHATASLRFDAERARPAPAPLAFDAGDTTGEPLAGERFYAGLAALGYDFGPAFRGVRSVTRDGDVAIAEVELPPGLSPEVSWHPALLDACLQTTAATWLFGPNADLWMPVSIERCVLAPLPAGERLRVLVRRHPSGEGMAFDLEIARLDGERIGHLHGLRSLRGDLGALGRDRGGERWLWATRWRAKPLPLPAAERLRAPAELFAAIGPTDERLRHGPRALGYRDGFVALEQLAVDFIVAALRALGLGLDAGMRVDADVAARLRVVPEQRRLFQRLLQILGEAAILRPSGDAWQVHRAPAERTAAELARAAQAVEDDHGPAVGGELALLARCGPALADVLTGRATPLELLFPDGDLELTTALYQHSPVFGGLGSVLADLAAAMPGRRDHAEPLAVLECGAGTGATTSHLLAALPPESTRYTFTDVSSLFTRKAAQRFAARRNLSFQLLDVERPPGEQGVSGRFDLVVAANVLHATRRIDQTLAHVASLVAPGGLLFLLEVTSRQRWADLTFGLLDGWWRFSDHDLRPDYALLSVDAWRERLSAAGFDDVEAITVDHAPAHVEGLGPVSCAHTIFVVRRGASPEATRAPWLVIERGDDPTATAVVAALHARGDAAQTFRLVAPPEAGPPEAGALVDTAAGWVHDSHDGFAALLAAHPSARGILHLCSVGLAAAPDDADAAMTAGRLGCGSLLHLLQASLEADSRAPIWAVTRGAQAIGDQAPNPAQAMVLGMARAVGEEHPDLALLRVDLDPQGPSPTADARRLLAEIDVPAPREAEVALRGPASAPTRWIARLQQVPSAPSQRSLAFPPERTTLITGAFGGLGPRLARWAAEHGARHLLLLGRSAPSPAVQAEAAALRTRGVTVDLAVADLADLDALTVALADRPPVGVVVHAVGALDDGALVRQSWARFERVLAPKVRGVCNLERATASAPVEHFILFSTATARLGNAGQANHAAANAFLDAFAQARRRRGQPALSIQWGRWTQIGAGADRRLDERFAAKGFGAIEPGAGLAALTDVIERDLDVVAILPVDFGRFLDRPLAEGVSAFLSEVAPAAAPPVSPAADPPSPADTASERPFAEQLAALPALDRRLHLDATVYALVEDVLGLGRGELDDPSLGLTDLGMDSLLAVELKNRLQQRLGCRLPATLAFDYPSPDRLASHLARDVFAAQLDAAPADAAPADADDLEALPLDDLAALLEGRLAR